MLKTEDCKVFWYGDLAEFVKQIYGQEIDIIQTIAWELRGQNTYHKFEIDPDDDYVLLDNIGDPEIVHKWVETGEIHHLDMCDVAEYDWADTADVEVKHILHRLFKDGHIEAGKYLMTVWW